jgi:hypothetical protein
VQHGVPQARKEVPTLAQFAPRFLDGYARANRQKASGVAAKEMVLRVHLTPTPGTRRLDMIFNEDLQRLKHRLLKKAAKTVNNILTVLNVLLKEAVEWGVIERLPCTIKLLPVPKEHRQQRHRTNPLERLNKEIKRGSNVRGIFPTVRGRLSGVDQWPHLGVHRDLVRGVVCEMGHIGNGGIADVDEGDGRVGWTREWCRAGHIGVRRRPTTSRPSDADVRTERRVGRGEKTFVRAAQVTSGLPPLRCSQWRARAASKATRRTSTWALLLRRRTPYRTLTEAPLVSTGARRGPGHLGRWPRRRTSLRAPVRFGESQDDHG